MAHSRVAAGPGECSWPLIPIRPSRCFSPPWTSRRASAPAFSTRRVRGMRGFGTVFKAFDDKLHRMVAIKVLAAALAASGTACKRFIREAQAAAAVKNDHIVAIHNVEDEHQPPYLVMELIDGVSLQDRLNKK